MAGSGKHHHIILGMDTLLNTLNLITMTLGFNHSIFFTTDTLALASSKELASKAYTGHLRSILLAARSTYISVRLVFIRPAPVLTILVSPSVVLLDNHTTTRIGWNVEISFLRVMAGSGRINQVLLNLGVVIMLII